MNEELYDIEGGEPTGEQKLAREAVRGLSAPEASADFRGALRARFVADESTEASDGSRRARGERAREGDRDVRRRAPRRRGFAWAAPLAMAAVIAIMVVVQNQGRDWAIVNASGDHVLVDGAPMDCDDLSPLEAALSPGCEVQVPEGGQLEIVTDALALQINGGMDVILPAPPGRWFGRDIESQVGGVGTLRVATGDAFAGASFRIRTGPTELLVTGTAFSVMSMPDVVCVCVLEGGIAASMPDGSVTDIPSGGRFTVQREGGAFETGTMHEAERGALEQLKARVTAP